MLAEELFYRAGGLVRVYPIMDTPLMLHVNASRSSNMERLSGYTHTLLADGPKIKKGDVMFLFSNSGRNVVPLEMAVEAKELGAKTICITNLNHSSHVTSRHASGKKLYEFVTLALDNCAPAAEAMLQVEGLEAYFAAASGIASDYIMWSLTSVCIEKMLADGFTPGILKSANFPGGNDYNKTVIEPHYDTYGW